ncbi:MAG: exostosin family protein [Symploca sp. SIO2C1]|nr:exostosin family protein [Symploca sp. SIO2C1]
MIQSDYILCCRGSGNYSYRLYETLCMGRIPIFINTDCTLPYDFLIDWKEYCVWIEESEIDQASSKLIDFHNSLSEKDFINLQYKCREIWLKWLSPEGFFSNFYHHLPQFKIKQG